MHDIEANAGAQHEQFRGHMLAGGRSGRGHINLPRARLGTGRQFLNGALRHRRVRNHQQGHHHNIGDEGKIFFHIIGQARHHRRVHAKRAGCAGEQRITICRRARDGFNTGHGSATSAIFHHHALRPALGKLIGKQPSEDIGGLPRRERHHNAHRAIGPIRLSLRSKGGERGSAHHGATAELQGHGFSPGWLPQANHSRDAPGKVSQ